MAIRFFLGDPRMAKSNIKVILTHNGKKYSRTIGISVPTECWDQKSQRAKLELGGKEAAAANFKVQQLRAALDRLIGKNPEVKDKEHFWAMVDCEVDHKPYTTNYLSKQTFIEYFEYTYIPRYRYDKSMLRVKRLNTTLGILKKLELSTKQSYTFDLIDSHYYRKLQDYFKLCCYSPNYFGITVKIVKQVMREALCVDKIHSNQEFLGANFKAISAEVDTVYLTTAEIDAIDQLVIDESFIKIFYPTSNYSGLQARIRSYKLAKNLFLIGTQTGLRVSDFTRLRADHFSDGKLSIVTEKTGAKIIVPVSQIVQRILDGGFDFTQKLSEQKMRIYIKHICQVAGINQIVEVRQRSMTGTVIERRPKYELVGTHTARRSFATNAYKAGIPPLAIMKITGHTKESTFMKYIRVSQEENADILAQHPFFKK